MTPSFLFVFARERVSKVSNVKPWIEERFGKLNYLDIFADTKIDLMNELATKILRVGEVVYK